MISIIRGVSFQIPQMISDTLLQILKCIDIAQYDWYNIDSQNEVWSDSRQELFFQANFYDGKSFALCIQEYHYIIFLKLQAYFPNSQCYDIHTYQEFVESDCQILLLVYDCEFVEIYIKDFAISQAIYQNAILNHYTDVVYITDTNDGRTKMDIL